MACSGEPLMAWAAWPTNQPRSSPAGSASQAPVKCQVLSQISTQVCLPLLLVHRGVPASRVGTATLRQASLSRIDSPVQEARPVSIDSLGLWCGCLRAGEDLTFSFSKTVEFSFCAASDGVLQSLTIGRHRSKSSLRQGSRFSSTLA